MQRQTTAEATPTAWRGQTVWPKDRVLQLAEELSPARRARIEPDFAWLLSDEAPGLQDPAWAELTDALAQDFLGDYQSNPGHIRELVRLLQISDPQLLQSFRGIYQMLRQAPLSSYPSLTEALALYRVEEKIHPLVRRLLFQLFVIAINRRLQLLYQMYLAGQPFAADSTEDNRLQHLQPLEALARRLLAGCDLPGLLRWLAFDPQGQGVEGFLMALNKYYFDPYRVNFRFTHHCNIQCAHCYNFSGPKMKAERIATERMLAIVEELPRAGIPAMNLTGGEPFMYLDTMLELIAAARKSGVTTISIYTNGFFAKSEENGRKVLERLKAAGFGTGIGRDGDHIKTSAGVFHQEFLPFQTIVNLIRAYHQVFGRKISVDYEILENQLEAQDEIRRILDAEGVADLVEIIFRSITPLGRAAQFDPKLDHHAAADFNTCGSINEIVFDPDGSVLPCCGMNFGNRGIAIGDINDDRLPRLLSRMENNPILQFIADNRIGEIFDYLDKSPAKTGYSDICNLCQHALGDLQDSEEVKRRLAPVQEFFPFWFTEAHIALA